MEDTKDKYDTVFINSYINELMSQTQVTQYLKNTSNNPIELEIITPLISDITMTRFEVIKNGQKIISKILEKEKAKEKYSDTIATGNSSIVSYQEENQNKICLGNLDSNEEMELKTYFFGHILCKDLSYQAKFPVIFPNFLLENIKTGESIENYKYKKKTVKGKIKINTNSKINRLVVSCSNNFSKIEKKYTDDKKSVDIDIFKDNFSDKDIPGIILFRTEKIYDEKLYYQYDPNKNKSYYMVQKNLFVPEFNMDLTENVDETENRDYSSLIKEEEEKEDKEVCYIFLLDQSYSMEGNSINLSIKSLLLFLQSLNQKCYFQLVGFGSDYKFFSEKPLAYNRENIKNLMDEIKSLKANRGGTELYKPLYEIYNNKVYEEYNMKKSIILLTDGQLFDKEQVINLIASKSDDFIFNSLGIGLCDKDLIERTALMGRGQSNYIKNLNDLTSVVVSMLDKAKEYLNLNYTLNQKALIEDANKKIIEKYEFFTHGFIIDGEFMKDIELNVKINKKDEIKISFNSDKITKLPDGDKLGKLIVDNYLKSDVQNDEKIKLSKEYSILTNETSFYAKIIKEAPTTEKMTKITNKDKQAENNVIHPQPQPQNQSEIKEDVYKIDDDKYLGYDVLVFHDDENETVDEVKPKKEPKKGLFSGLFSKFLSKEKNPVQTIQTSGIIKKKKYKYEFKDEYKKEKKKNKSKKISGTAKTGFFDFFTRNLKKNVQERAYLDYLSCQPNVDCSSDNYDRYDLDGAYDISYKDYDDDYEETSYKSSYKMDSDSFMTNAYKINFNDSSDNTNKNEIKNDKVDDFDELIIAQDIIEGNWTNDSQAQQLIKKEKDIYEKIKKIAESKGIKEENGIITIFILYYIYNKKSEKLTELKFVIKKAKNYLNKKFNMEYDNIIQGI